MLDSEPSACSHVDSLTISVVSPSYNQAEFLAECLSSVRDQTYKPIEHLVFDPGSTDGSRDIAASFPHVTLIAEPDEGQSDAVNKGFSRARGDIIAWLNSDDCLAHPSVLERVVQRFLQADEPDIVYGRGIFIDESGKKLRDVYINKDSASLNWRFQQEDGILQPALFMRQSVIDRVGPLRNDLHYCMDYEYWIRCVKAGVKFVYLDLDLAIARYHDNNKTYGMRGKSYTEVCDMMKEHFGYVNHVWLKRYAEFLSDGYDGVLAYAGNSGVKDVNKLDKIYRSLLLAYNGSHDSSRLLSERASDKGFGDTLREMKKLKVGSPVPCYEIPVEQKQESGCVTYTVGSRRWAFDAQWKAAQIAKSHEFFRNSMAQRHHDTCIIVGNGPSLNKTDLSLLKNQDVIVSNNVFLSDELLRYATYFTVVNYLVAEQSSQHINMLEGVHKVLPYWLAYCLNPGPNAYFVDAVGYAEFSKNIFENMSWRHTVTFFNLHLAYGLGYRKVVMIGFDHNYKQPKGVVEQEIIQSYDEDENHFHSGYFRGKKWQAADTSNMEEMYLLAKTAYEKDEREIVNCTIGGKLEVFRRGDLHAELGLESGKKEGLAKLGEGKNLSLVKSDFSNQKCGKKIYPKLLFIDATKIGDGTATGELKKNLLGGWPKENILQIYGVADEKVGMYGLSSTEGVWIESKKIREDVKQYNPDVVLYRPVPDNGLLHSLAMQLIFQGNLPLVTWTMDDWPARLKREDYNKYMKIEQDYRVLLERASLNLSISQAMSCAFKERYGVTFIPLANGVSLEQWPRKDVCTQKQKTVLVRYAGSLAENMTLQSIVRVAQAIEKIGENYEIKLEIRTKKLWRDKARQYFRGLKRTFFLVDQLSSEDYRVWISEADMLVIAYNYDPISVEYIQYSFANKLPECLASGAVILAHGPAGVATIDYLQSNGCAAVVHDDSEDSLIQEIEKVITDNSYRVGLVEKARRVASENHDLIELREKMQTLFIQVSQSRANASHAGFLTMDREVHAHLDETKIVAHLLATLPACSVMIDVGAHHGTALAPFGEMGWKVFAFEPDPENRKCLLERYGDAQNIAIDPRAVGECAETGVAFYVSEESTGISSMLAFRDSHKPADAVDVTTVAGIIADNNIEHVNFLKIDVEGYDFSVLKSVPWGGIEPDVIECEFEDAKTKYLGHSWKDICEYLVTKGYAVYVSEWHPIIRYGIRHDWRQLIRYPCELADSNGWGNLLAFKNDPGAAAMQEALHEVLTVKYPQNINNSTESQNVAITEVKQSGFKSSGNSKPIMKQRLLARFPSYAYFAEWVRGKNLSLFRIGQFAMWVLRFLKRHPAASVLGLMMLSALVLAPILISTFASYGSYFWTAAVLLMLSAISGMGVSFGNKKMAEFIEREHCYRQVLRAEMLRERAQIKAEILRGLKKQEEQLVSRVKAQGKALDLKLHRLAGSAPVFNFSDYQPFNRRLTKAHRDVLQQEWSSKLNIKVTPRSLAYLAHRICTLESAAKGRLASTIEDAVLRVLVASAVKTKNLRVLEIGTLFGIGLAAIYDHTSSLFTQIHLTAMDPLDGYYGKDMQDIVTNEIISESTFRGNLARAGVTKDEITLVKAMSTEDAAIEAATKLPHDVLIIDGDHSYAGVKADFVNYLSAVKRGGYIIFDDYNAPEWPDVKEFVDTSVRDNSNVTLVGTSWRTAVFRVVCPEIVSEPTVAEKQHNAEDMS